MELAFYSNLSTMPSLHDTLVWFISLAAIAGVLLRPRGWAEAWWAFGGALLLLALIPPALAGAAVLKGVDVYLFLAGMMILSELAREEGVFDWIAEIAAAHAAGSPRRLFLLIYLAGTVVTAFLSNDATAVVLTPAVLAIVRRLEVEPVPHLLACAFIANAASFLLPISNPANLVIYGAHLPPLLSWMRIYLLPSIASVVVTFAALRGVTRKDLLPDIRITLPGTKLSAQGRLALAGLAAAAAVLVAASALGRPLGAPTCGAAVLATLVATFRHRALPLKIVRGVSWSVLPLVAGLFVIVEALQSAGLLRLAVEGLNAAARLGPVAGGFLTAFAVGLLSNGMNNLPVGLIGGAALHAVGDQAHLDHAMLIGVDLGPNLSVAGSLATILWLIALRREKVRLTGWQFLRAGLFIMPLALAAAVLALVLS
jgi:arsenical pump membrane protein